MVGSFMFIPMANELIPHERIKSRIYIIRGRKVMLDRDLAELYQVETRILNQAVKRNPGRFPSDFVFKLSDVELKNLRSQFVISSLGYGGARYTPLAFTEQGVAMLSSVLNSERAIAVNIQIIRAFTRLRDHIAGNEELRLKIELMEKQYGEQFKMVFDAIRGLLSEPDNEASEIGFKIKP